MVEQGSEEPCVVSSILTLGTRKSVDLRVGGFSVILSLLMRTLFFAFIIALALPFSIAEAAEGYAASVVVSSSNLLTPTNALGAPDGAYADFLAQDANMTLDFGEEVNGSLTVNLYLLQAGASFQTVFYDSAGDILTTVGTNIPLSTTELTVTYSGVAYRQVRIINAEGETWRLDALRAADYGVEEVVEEPPVEEPVVEEEEATPSASYSAGTMIKLADAAAVYILGADGKRHAFPTESVFTSWGLSFDDVVTVDATAMAAWTLGRNVTVRAGTYLVKVQTNPKVFAVEPGGVLRWVASEAIALQLYGIDWAERVIDVSDAFWSNYTVGESIDSSVHPDGTLLVDGGFWYIADAGRALITSDLEEAYRFLTEFGIEDVNSTIFGQYDETEADLLLEGTKWPY